MDTTERVDEEPTFSKGTETSMRSELYWSCRDCLPREFEQFKFFVDCLAKGGLGDIGWCLTDTLVDMAEI